MPKLRKDDTQPKRRAAPAKTLEARENQLISLAVDLAEKQLIEGTASSQVITELLKRSSTKERLEKEKLKKENELLRARTDALQSAKNVEALYTNALGAMRRYSGNSFNNDVTEREDDPDDD